MKPWNNQIIVAAGVTAALFATVAVRAENASFILDRQNSTIVLEPYAPNIIRVTMSRLKDKAVAAPGYGFTASPSAAGVKVGSSVNAAAKRFSARAASRR